MRAFPRAAAVALALVLSTGAGIHAQLPASVQGLPQTLTEDAKRRNEESARQMGAELAAMARATTIGSLSAEASLAFHRWGEAVRLWKGEAGGGAAPLLADGVLFDCLDRLHGVVMPWVSTERAVPSPGESPASAPTRALKAFDAALKIDPGLIEARMRAARMRAVKDAKAALELEHIANDRSGSPFSYLAAVSRAALAHSKHEVAVATRWYERALEFNPRSTAARIGLSALDPAAALPFEALDASDLYYTYPCRVLTMDVATALTARVKLVVLK